MVEIFDSTLRDGAQGEGVTFSVEDKINITKALDKIGISFIEAGNPGSNPKDLDFFERASKLHLKNAKLCAFGSTRRSLIKPEDDKNLNSLLAAGTEYVVIFGKSWDLHVEKILHTTLEENLNMIRDSIAFLKSRGKKVIFDAEHFFDGCKDNEKYAFDTLKAACEGGADTICLCDTRGATYPTDIYKITKKAVDACGVKIAIHCHNDTGMAVACTLFAVDAGASQVQGTFIGFGERCGNTNLSTIIPDLQLKQGIPCIPEENMPLLTRVAKTIAEITNITLPSSLPYVGTSAFAHKGGMHIDGVTKLSRSFEHISPDLVGNERRFLMSEVSGRSTFLAEIQKIDPTITKDDVKTKEIIAKIKEMEHFGYQFEAATSSVELLIRKQLNRYKPFFKLDHYKIIGEQPVRDARECCTAVIKISVGGTFEITAAQGDGPVHALDCAVKKALSKFYPQLQHVHLKDYKVRVLEPRDATASKVRVLIESSDGTRTWSNVGVSKDIIEASWIALVDSIEYKLTLDTEKEAANEEE